MIFTYVLYILALLVRNFFSQRGDDIFALIEHDILKYSQLGKCFVLSDFNARTHIEHDFIDNDSDKFLDIQCSYQADAPLLRRNIDSHTVDKHGKSLLSLCKSSGLRILNGRKLGDLNGNFTCYNHVGSPSTIDYILCDASLVSEVKYVKVHPLTPYTIHCMVSCHINVNFLTYDDSEIDSDILSDQPAQFVWSDNCADRWLFTVTDSMTQNEIDKFLHSSLSSNELNSDDLVNDFSHIINSIGQRAGIWKKKASVHGKSAGHKKSSFSQKWYDNDCKKLHLHLKSLSRCIRKNPYNTTLITKYRFLKKKYSKLLKLKKCVFRTKIFDMLDNLESRDPKGFWNLYNELSPQKKHSQSAISAVQWWSHFNMLMNKCINHDDLAFEKSIEEFWSHYNNDVISNLDSEITCDELRQSVY